MRAGSGAGNRILVRRPARCAGDGTPGRNEPDRPSAMAIELFLWPGVAGAGFENLEWARRGGRAGGFVASRPLQFSGALRALFRGDGSRKTGGVTGAAG